MIKAYLGKADNSITDYRLADSTIAWFEATDPSGVQNVKIKVEKKDDSQFKVKASGELLFYNEDKDFILKNLVTNLPSPDSYVWLRLYDDCCNEDIFIGHITADLIEWCTNECFVKCNAKEYTKITDAFNFIKNNVIIYDDVDTLHFPYRKRLTSLSTRYIPSANLRDLLVKNLQRANIVFKSDILNNPILNQWTGDNYQDFNGINPYVHTYLVSAEFTQGEQTPTETIDPDNVMLESIKGFLDRLKDVYNADYWIIDVGGQKVLEFERSDYFTYKATNWSDARNLGVCLEVDDKNKYAYFDGKWQKNFHNDSDDKKMHYAYNEIVEWNRPVNPLFSGAKKVSLSFSYAEVDMTDGSGFDVLNLDKSGLCTSPMLVISQVAPNRNLSASIYRMRNDTNFLASVHNNPYPSLEIYYEYNSPYWFSNDSVTNGHDEFVTTMGLMRPYVYTLFDNFHFIDNPRNLPNGRGYFSKKRRLGYKFKLDIDFDCVLFNSFDVNSGILLNIDGVDVTALATSLEFDFKTKIVKIEGKI